MTFFADFLSRSSLPEIMDHPSTSESAFLRAMAEIRWVNRHLNGTACILDPLKKLCKDIPPEYPLQILDLGTASADIPRAIVQWARSENRVLFITGIDIHPTAVREAQRYVINYPEINIVQGNALDLADLVTTYDFVISSMFLHHLDDENAVLLLKNMATHAKRGFIINDLERHPLAWLGIRILGWMTFKGKIFRYDSALSVRRAFSKQDLKALCQKAGLHQVQIEHCHPFRWVITWQKPQTNYAE